MIIVDTALEQREREAKPACPSPGGIRCSVSE